MIRTAVQLIGDRIGIDGPVRLQSGISVSEGVLLSIQRAVFLRKGPSLEDMAFIDRIFDLYLTAGCSFIHRLS